MRLIRSMCQRRGQALTEFALVFPIFLVALMAVIVLGLLVFNNQQLENAAREAARYAAVHSTGSVCPTVSRLDPIFTVNGGPPARCDAPENGWPKMTAAARNAVWGLNASQVQVRGCWSGYVDPAGHSDALPEPPNTFTECTIGTVNPRSNPDGIPCPPPVTSSGSTPQTADGDDKASALAYGSGQAYPTTVTVFVCYNWQPPMAGLLFIPSTVTLRAVITEAIQRQQGGS
jgi:TadE-like protein